MSRLYLNKTICLGLLLLLAGLAWASSDRAAMVVETRGKNVVRFNGEDAPMRTLQVLPQGARVTVDNGAIVRLSYLKSGTKETVTGPCQIEIEAGKSRKISQSGELKSKTNRGSSTDLPSTENLRRTGGALQAYRFTETPDSRLAMLELSLIHI